VARDGARDNNFVSIATGLDW